MFDLFDNLEPWIKIIEGIVLILIGIGIIWGGPKFLANLERIVNLLERITGRDLDGDGDIAQPGDPDDTNQ